MREMERETEKGNRRERGGSRREDRRVDYSCAIFHFKQLVDLLQSSL